MSSRRRPGWLIALASLVLLPAACFGGEPVPDPTQTAPASGAPAPEAFTCAEAPRLLGLPAYTVQVCREVPHLKGFYKITLTHPTEGTIARLVPTRADGQIEAARGPAAATAWLRQSGSLEDAGLGMVHIMMCLHAFEALPAPLTLDAQDFDDRPIGTPGFTAKPFRLELYEAVGQDGTPGVGRFIRGVLTAGADGKLAWTLETGTGPGGWAPLAQVAAE